MSEIEFRSANTQVVDVSYPKRTVTVIVSPYESPTMVHTANGSFVEVVSRGAYDGVQRRAGKIKANRDHKWERLAGRVTGLYPDRDEGLVADVRMFKTPLGDETLELCADQGLAASAGLALMHEDGLTGPVKRGAEVWERNRSIRRLNELYLDHVAFVPDPAYEDATVLEVRHSQDQGGDGLLLVTPNRDRLELDRLRAEMALIDSRYRV